MRVLIAIGLMSAAACGGSDARLVPDAAPMSDAQPPPASTTTVSVSIQGSDAADGLSAPVKTLARAFAIAKANGAITTIKIAPGRYGAANGDVYPQLVPADVRVEGSSDGEVVLAGDRSGAGLALERGELANLTLEDFSVALTATRAAKLTAIRIHSSGVALRVEQSARLEVVALQITGAAQACATGIELVGRTHLDVDGLVTNGLGAHVDVQEEATIAVANALVTGDPACAQTLFTIAGGGLHTIGSSTFEGGGTAVRFAPTQSAAIATLTDVTIKHAAVGLDIEAGQLSMTRGTLDQNATGANVVAGVATFRNVAITGNRDRGVDAAGVVDMTASTVTGNATGIRCGGPNRCILTDNLIQNVVVGVEAPDDDSLVTVTARRNTWIPDTQGADAEGHYATAEILGPASGSNFSLGRFGVLRL